MKTIHKYPLDVLPVTVLQIPNTYKILHLGMQNNQPYIWVEVYTSFMIEEVTIHTYATGQELPDNEKYIGTYTRDGYVMHVYETLS